ncbi:MAG TPA: DUF1697 domain-containing protein [Acidobacteriota bacterium]|jgi:uncharacterized protein (DUF1697 family)
MASFVALLRGINVGGKNIIRMADLKACFESQGFQGVATYIQSGNVVFKAGAAQARLVSQIEKALTAAFNYRASVVLRSARQMRDTVAGAPRGFGSEPAEFRYDVLFLKDTLEPAAALKQVPVQPGVDRVFAGPGALYFSRLIAKASQSRLPRITALPIYQSMTIRNWNTTLALSKMAEEA